ncbi:hypothetical protein AXA44_24200 [Rhodococcus sp. SC4]|nr:hypothetical protein AXA44_24200 [Rhodococcus sp. SC4]
MTRDEELLQTKSSIGLDVRHPGRAGESRAGESRAGESRAGESIEQVEHSAREHFANGKVRDSFSPAVLGLWRAFRC